MNGFLPEELRDIAARASTLDERRAAEPGKGSTESKGMAGWCASAAGGDFQLFHKWLAVRGLQPDAAASLFGSATLPAGMALPPWAEAFEWSAVAMAAPHREASRFLDSRWPVPFEHLFSGLIHEAQHRRDTRMWATCRCFSRWPPTAEVRRTV